MPTTDCCSIVCAQNEKNVQRLEKLNKTLPTNIILKIFRTIPHVEFLDYLKVSDIYLTKAGGLSLTEGAALAKPMIILGTASSGQERENAALFEKYNYAIVNKKIENIGEDVNKILSDETFRTKMIDEQNKFSSFLNLEKIVDFVLDLKPSQTPVEKIEVLEGNTGFVVESAKTILSRQTESTSKYDVIKSLAGKAQEITGDNFTATELLVLRLTLGEAYNIVCTGVSPGEFDPKDDQALESAKKNLETMLMDVILAQEDQWVDEGKKGKNPATAEGMLKYGEEVYKEAGSNDSKLFRLVFKDFEAFKYFARKGE